MQPIERSACAKIILCGEHAVVYGRPAIALPLPRLRARAVMHAHDDSLEIFAADLEETVRVAVAPDTHPLARLARSVCERLAIALPNARIVLRSEIPIGANLGSGAAISIALARVISAWHGQEFTAHEASEAAFEIEKLHHGTPSGIDNTTIAYEQPVRFVRGAVPVVLRSPGIAQLPIVIADTGRSTPTHVPVGDVRTAWQADPVRLERIFDDIAACVAEAQQALEAELPAQLGDAMNENHRLLQVLGVSSPELDLLCDAARRAGALGAKMSGGGRGGNMLCLAQDAQHAEHLAGALHHAGAARIFNGS